VVAFIVSMLATFLLLLMWKKQFDLYSKKFDAYKRSNSEYIDRINELEDAIENGNTVRVRVIEKTADVSIPPHVMRFIESILTEYATAPGKRIKIDDMKVLITVIEKLRESSKEADNAARYRVVSYLPDRDDKEDGEPDRL